jgi:hypothetical protein
VNAERQEFNNENNSLVSNLIAKRPFFAAEGQPLAWCYTDLKVEDNSGLGIRSPEAVPGGNPNKSCPPYAFSWLMTTP